MKEHLKKTIELLKNRVQNNLELIKRNELNVRNTLQDPISTDRSEQLNENFNSNKKILEENSESIKIQLSIIKFLSRFENNIEKSINKENSEKTNISKEEEIKKDDFEIEGLSKSDYFDLIINKSLIFNDSNPFYNDDEFFNDLIEYFTDIEDYEMCSELISLPRK